MDLYDKINFKSIIYLSYKEIFIKNYKYLIIFIFLISKLFQDHKYILDVFSKLFFLLHYHKNNN